MSTITISIKGASRGAKLRWNARGKALLRTSGGYSTEFEVDEGTHVYVISVLGAPGEKWSAKVKGGDATFEHVGHMSPGGADTTSDTPYEVS